MPRRPTPAKKARTVGAPLLKKSVADLRALAHPLRLRMMELFAESPKTTKQVAALLGQPPTRLYHHVAALERAGLLVLRETRQNRGAVEKWYGAVAQQLAAAHPRHATSRQARATRRAVAATVLEQAKLEIMTAAADSEPALLARIVVSAPPAMIPVVRRRLYDAIHAIREEIESHDTRTTSVEDAERWAVTVAFSPVAPPPKP